MDGKAEGGLVCVVALLQIILIIFYQLIKLAVFFFDYSNLHVLPTAWSDFFGVIQLIKVGILLAVVDHHLLIMALMINH